ncbi:MAG: hypothetical protein GY866_32675 [Proteobacteria bacterium]|nr:hypothetical protein [Pseudomonadota bacterium]
MKHILIPIFALILASWTPITAQQPDSSQNQETASGDTVYLRTKNRSAQKFVKSNSDFVRLSKRRIILRLSPEQRQALSKRGSVKGTASEETLTPVYYRNGIVSESTRFIPTGKILISFGKNNRTDYSQFATENNLIFIREINRLYHTGLFRQVGSDDLIEQVNRLNQLPEVRTAKPDWISPRRLR